MQRPQPGQHRGSTAAVLRPKPLAPSVTRVRASKGQAATQRPQPVQVVSILRREPTRFTPSSKCETAFDEFFDDADLPLQLVVAVFELDDLVPNAGLPFLEDRQLRPGILDHPA